MRFIKQDEAKLIDEKLMSSQYAFSLDQLMELAGLSIAEAVQEYYCHNPKRILICCGPGNNGGDGLVAGRHLKMFGNHVDVLIPIRKDKYAVFYVL
jgi:NAD(P)H-hydrate epimerase